jgi:anti-sigma B factor antagonist/stage II sporulation protein AA (anti-sigma F factor antagonist)
MKIGEETRDGVLVIAPEGRLDSNTAGALEGALRERLDGHRRLVIDLAAVDYVSSAGLRVLLLAAKRLRDAQGDLVLCSLADSVRQIFEFAGFTRIFTIEPSRESALVRLGSAG